MTLRLRDEDRRAVDLLLDRAATGSGQNPARAGNGIGNGHGNSTGQGNGHPGFTQVSGDVQSRVPAVQKVLDMLDLMPAEDPPQDLVSRTVRRVDTEYADHHPAALRGTEALLGSPMQQPHA